jgi:dynein heavy chain
MKCTSSDAITRLWAHEVLRVFQDRLVTAEDHAWFTSMLSDTLTRSFRLTSPIEPVRHA